MNPPNIFYVSNFFRSHALRVIIWLIINLLRYYIRLLDITNNLVYYKFSKLKFSFLFSTSGIWIRLIPENVYIIGLIKDELNENLGNCGSVLEPLKWNSQRTCPWANSGWKFGYFYNPVIETLFYHEFGFSWIIKTRNETH